MLCVSFYKQSNSNSVTAYPLDSAPAESSCHGVLEHGASPSVRKEMFYLMTHPTHFSYGYVALDIW